MKNISEHISYREAVFSHVAIRYRVDNTPNLTQFTNMIKLAVNVFEPLRKGLGNRPVKISSFFRCKDLNDLIGGAAGSQHMAIRGAAMDIDNDGVPEGPSNKEIFDYIDLYIEFDQLIWEYGTDENPDWVHVSYNEGKNRGQKLRCLNGKYIPYI